jgi:hypothetical protein
MNPNQTKDPGRNAYGQNPQTKSRDKQRDDKAASKPDKRDEMNDPVGTPETNRPIEEGKGKPVDQDLEPRRQPREDERSSREPGSRSDVLKPGR